MQFPMLSEVLRIIVGALSGGVAWVRANAVPLLSVIAVGLGIVGAGIAWLTARSNFYTALQDLLRCRLNIRDTRRSVSGETWTAVLACRRAGELQRVVRKYQREQFLISVALLSKFVLAKARDGRTITNEHIDHLERCCEAVENFPEVDEDYTKASHEEKIETYYEEFLELDVSGMEFSDFRESLNKAIDEGNRRHPDSEGPWMEDTFDPEGFSEAWKAAN